MTTIPRHRPVALLLSGVLLLAGCSEKAETTAEKMEAASVPGAPPGGAADIAAKAATASAVEDKTALIEFSYNYPVEAARIHRLAAWLDSDREQQRGALRDAAPRHRAPGGKQAYPSPAHDHHTHW